MPDTIACTTLSFDGARKVLDAALAKADELGIAFCIAVTDTSGVPLVTARMDGAPWGSVPIAANKAQTVVAFGMPTSEWWDAIKGEPALVHGITHTPNLIVFGGGVGIYSGDELVGAIGASGGRGDEDDVVAAAGAAAIG